MPLTPNEATDVAYEILGRAEKGLSQAIEAMIEMRGFCAEAYADGNIATGDIANANMNGAMQSAAEISEALENVMAYHRGLRGLAEAKGVKVSKPYAHMPARMLKSGGR